MSCPDSKYLGSRNFKFVCYHTGVKERIVLGNSTPKELKRLRSMKYQCSRQIRSLCATLKTTYWFRHFHLSVRMW